MDDVPSRLSRELASAIATAIANDAIDSQHLAADSIDAEHYAAGSVDATAIGNDEVNSQHYAAASIDNEHLADDAVGIAELSATGTASSSTFEQLAYVTPFSALFEKRHKPEVWISPRHRLGF